MRSAPGALVLLAFVSLGPVAAHGATLVNPGFETGDLTGWDTFLRNGTAAVVADLDGYHPPMGGHFLAVGGGAANSQQYVWQGVNLTKGDVLKGWAALDHAATDVSFSDWAAAEVFNSGLDTLVAPIWRSPSSPSAGWEKWTWNVPYTGYFYIAFSSSTDAATYSRSLGLFDVRDTPNPEPGTVALMLLGLPVAALLRRRR